MKWKMDLKVLLGDFDMENSSSVDIALSQIKCKEVRFSCIIFCVNSMCSVAPILIRQTSKPQRMNIK